MQINENGLALVKHFEGLFLKAYVDPVGVVTIGYGHTKTAKKGMIITEEEAEALLRQDLQESEESVAEAVKVKLNEDQFSALVSFTFNVGAGAFLGSTLLKQLNKGDYDGAASQFGAWVKGTVSGKKVTLPGLVRRREAERKLFADGIVDFGFGPIAVGTVPSNNGGIGSSNGSNFSSNSAEAEFTKLFNSWGIKHFKAFELLVMGHQNSNPDSPAYKLNRFPPKELWPNIRPTVVVLDKLREKIGMPIQTLSVYRSPEYNKAIGGANQSMHMKFNAIDFIVKGTTLSPSQWAGLLQEMEASGEFSGWIGTYPSFVHVDTRGDI